MIFLLITQKQFETLGHIMSEIATIPKSSWPVKFYKFETVFLNFNKQRVKSKSQVGAIATRDDVKGFVNTLAGYKAALEAEIKVCNKYFRRRALKRSHKRIESIRAEISAQLIAQNFNVK